MVTTTQVTVTLDGRILIQQRHALVELVSLAETAEFSAALAEAAALQAAIWPAEDLTK
jgi:hypothetical protein